MQPPPQWGHGYGPPSGYGQPQGYGYGQQPPYGPPPKKGMSVGAIAAIVIGGVVVLSIAAAGAGGSKSDRASKTATTAAAAPTEDSAPPQIATPKKSEPEAKAAPKPDPAIEITATKLFADYEANEVSADNRYKGRRIHVTGVVDGVDKDFMDDVIVRLQTSNEFMSVSLYGVNKGTAAQLAKGQKFSATCTGDGKVMIPILRECAAD